MTSIVDRLSGGDRRSIGQVDEVVTQVMEQPALFDELFAGLLVDDPVVRIRACDAVEKITRRRPEYLSPFKKALIEEVALIEQQEVRWHFAQIAPRLELDKTERTSVVNILEGYLDDRSRIVQVCALQALVELAQKDPSLRPRVQTYLQQGLENDSPAVKSRCKKLLDQLGGSIE